MIKGNKPSGYITDFASQKVKAETRQCSHCQFTWTYIPGFKTGIQRAICLHCMGLICNRKICHTSCAPFSEIAIDENLMKKYTLSVGGIYIKK